MEIFIRGLIALGIALAVATLGFSDTVAPATTVKVTGGCGCSGKKLFGNLHLFGNGCGGQAKAAPHAEAPRHAGPRTQPGTVVFPQHPFVRSPRDFFMAD